MATLYHIYLKPKEGVTSEQVEAKLSLALDWFRYGDNCWIVETTSDPAKWHTLIKPLADPDGYFFVCKLDPSARHGWMPETFWEWLGSKT